jgi:2-polyprenyl-3-methyl-5-hydroxy-6-metoxy-1,4-benzoquinol methylase
MEDLVKGSCRGCGDTLHHVFVDLGDSPIANHFLRPDQLDMQERAYPLCVYVCGSCLLVQIEELAAPHAIFNDGYAYYSSYSETWVQHARDYVEMMLDRFGFNASHRVVEIASNDGYLLQWFHQRGVPVLGIEPSINTARVAEAKGIPCLTRFFGTKLAEELAAQNRRADLLIGNNVLAHVPDILDFVAGLKRALQPAGIITVEFPHFLNLLQHGQFDTIYHEHFSYLSLLAVQRLFAASALTVFDVEEVSTHGGSLRVFARHAGAAEPPITDRVETLLGRERAAGLDRLETYSGFAVRTAAWRTRFVGLLRELKKSGATLAGYGAPAKGNTLLNYCGITTALIAFTVDRSPAKQDHFLPGSRIPVYSPERVWTERPDFLVILPWNLKEEIIGQMAGIRAWGGQFIVPIPEPRVIP